MIDLENRLHEMNALAQVRRTTNSVVASSDVLDALANEWDIEQKMPETDVAFFNLEFAPMEVSKSAHLAEISSFSVKLDGLFNMAKLCCWMDYLTSRYPRSIYRVKGIFAIEGEECSYVIQGTAGVYNAVRGKPYLETEQPGSRIVVIGRCLDHNELAKGFSDCIVRNNLRCATNAQI